MLLPRGCQADLALSRVSGDSLSTLLQSSTGGAEHLPRASTVTNKSLASCCTAWKADWGYCPGAVKLIWLCLGSLETA